MQRRRGTLGDDSDMTVKRTSPEAKSIRSCESAIPPPSLSSSASRSRRLALYPFLRADASSLNFFARFIPSRWPIIVVPSSLPSSSFHFIIASPRSNLLVRALLLPFSFSLFTVSCFSRCSLLLVVFTFNLIPRFSPLFISFLSLSLSSLSLSSLYLPSSSPHTSFYPLTRYPLPYCNIIYFPRLFSDILPLSLQPSPALHFVSLSPRRRLVAASPWTLSV